MSPVPRSRVLGSPVPVSPGPWVPCPILSANAHGTSVCVSVQNTCVNLWLRSYVSIGLFTALTMGEREKREVEVKVTDGREGGREEEGNERSLQ